MTINFMTNVRLIRTLHPLLEKAENGRIVFTTSAIADDTPAYWGPYAASKAALNAFVKIYAAETMNSKLRINALHPGAVQTAMMDDAFPGGPDFETKAPEDVANDFLDLVSPSCTQHGQIIKLP
jgi:NAD(P)-dependent dehydrogenase (short-subunit alcohol dehydrogenase family)